ncbi:hypothetical protein IKE19_00965 [Candidatus Saccharibacteria bacterium]|nr:hypothetical protein [Candidatus Saccharibacteria bacterium]
MKPMPKTKKLKTFILINIFIFLATAIMVPITLIFGSVASQKDNLPFAYWQHIVTFTILSNIFLGIVALVSAIIGYKCFKAKKTLPTPLGTWYLIATTSAVLTFLTVVCYLAPSRALSGKNFFDMLIGPMFFLHFLDPILSAINYIFFFDGHHATKKDRLLTLIPPVLYAIPYALLIAVFKIVPDFYGLTFGGRYYLSLLVIAIFCLLVFGISTLLSYCHNRQIALK